MTSGHPPVMKPSHAVAPGPGVSGGGPAPHGPSRRDRQEMQGRFAAPDPRLGTQYPRSPHPLQPPQRTRDKRGSQRVPALRTQNLR